MNRSVVERARPADVSVEQELRARLESLRAMPVRALQDTYYDTHGRATHARNREWLMHMVHRGQAGILITLALAGIVIGIVYWRRKRAARAQA